MPMWGQDHGVLSLSATGDPEYRGGCKSLLDTALALQLAYATGLDTSEVVPLRVLDFDSGCLVIQVEQGKGRKDSYAILSLDLYELLRTC
jgi:site-specific recombinase XerD